MKRIFCDFCGNGPITSSATEGWTNETKLCLGENKGAIAVIRAVITLKEHPTGYGGPPDACEDCIASMINGIVTKQNKRSKGKK